MILLHGILCFSIFQCYVKAFLRGGDGWDVANHGFIYIKVIKPIALFVSGSANVFHNELMEYEFSFLFWWLICLEF